MTRSCALLFAAALVPLAGCGDKLHPVTGTVNLDGKPVASATVTFTSDDGKYVASGTTDESGHFSLAHVKGAGTYAGNYKVTVAKFPKVAGGLPPAMDGGKDKEYEKAMANEMKGKKSNMPQMPRGMSGVMPPPGMMPGSAVATSNVKSELPEMYASIEKTPLTATVPAAGPVVLELKSK